MNEITVCPKPEWVSWDEIHSILQSAHTVNRKRGLQMINANLSGEKIRQKVGDGLCLVAMDGEKVVGTQSVVTFIGDRWYSRGRTVAHYCLTGILKRYQGCGIKEQLDDATIPFLEKRKPSLLQANTAESNIIVRNALKKDGWVDVECVSFRGTDYYSVFSVKWLIPNPFPLWYCRFRYNLSSLYTKSRFKPGHIERFKLFVLLKKALRRIKFVLR